MHIWRFCFFIFQNEIYRQSVTKRFVEINRDCKKYQKKYEEIKKIPLHRLKEKLRILWLQATGTKDTLVERLTDELLTKKNETVKKPVIAVNNESQKGYCKNCNCQAPKGSLFCNQCGGSVEDIKLSLKTFFTTFCKIRKKEVTEHTYYNEVGFWKSILQALGGMPVEDITGAHWERYMGLLSERGVSGRTKYAHKNAFMACLKYAEITGHIKVMPRFRPIKGTHVRTRSVVPLTASEVHRLLDAASHPMYRALFSLGCGVGLRPSELLRVHWEDINLSKKTLLVRGTKTLLSTSTIPLTSLASREMNKWYFLRENPPKGLCFFNRRNKKVTIALIYIYIRNRKYH
eukprot:GHVL01005605.1.p1 GENE.GHVL01005605.1~~GHVL01005605.1.p1  ORF type:complete len:346 (+),score=74.06 GHVL01005605.1:86-1123(+)